MNSVFKQAWNLLVEESDSLAKDISVQTNEYRRIIGFGRNEQILSGQAVCSLFLVLDPDNMYISRYGSLIINFICEEPIKHTFCKFKIGQHLELLIDNGYKIDQIFSKNSKGEQSKM